jgi:hypothetical protein
VAIQSHITALDCFASLAMTVEAFAILIEPSAA